MTLYLTALRQQRLALVIWAVALALMNMAVVSAASAITDVDIQAFLGGLPEGMRQLFALDLLLERPLDGYMNSKLFLYLPLVVGIYAAFQAAGMVAREVERRQMDFVLGLPITRPYLLWARLQAIWTGCAVLWAATLATLAAEMARNGLRGDWTGYLLAAWVGFLLSGALGALSLWASAGASEYRRALRTGLGLTVALFLANMALQTLQAPAILRRATLFGLYDPGDLILTHRFPWPETAALLLVAGLASALAVRTFVRREV